MDLADLIEPDRVVFGARASNKQQLLQDLASRAAALLNLDAQTIFTALQAREELGSTGLGNGFALPHARVEGLDRFFGMFVRLQPAGPFRLDRRQAGRSRVSPAHPANSRQRAPRRARSVSQVPARQRIRRKIAQSAKRCRAVQPTLRSPTFVIFERLTSRRTRRKSLRTKIYRSDRYNFGQRFSPLRDRAECILCLASSLGGSDFAPNSPSCTVRRIHSTPSRQCDIETSRKIAHSC